MGHEQVGAIDFDPETDPLEWRVRANDPAVSPRHIQTDDGVVVLDEGAAPTALDVTFAVRFDENATACTVEGTECAEQLRRWSTAGRVSCTYACDADGLVARGTLQEDECAPLDELADRAIMAIVSAFGFDETNPVAARVRALNLTSHSVAECMGNSPAYGGDENPRDHRGITAAVLGAMLVVASALAGGYVVYRRRRKRTPSVPLPRPGA